MAEAAPRAALLAGASGLVGGRLLRLLLDDPSYGSVVSVARRPVVLSHPKLRQETVEFSRLPPLAGDDLFVCLGTTIKKAGSREAFRRVDHDFVLDLARRAREGGAKRLFLVSSSGANAKSPIFYSRVKGETEAAVAALGYETVFLLRPSLLLGERGEARLGERLAAPVMRALRPLLLGPLRRYRAIEAEAVARAMLKLSWTREAGVRAVESDALEDLGSC